MREPASRDRPARGQELGCRHADEAWRNYAVGTSSGESGARHTINYRACAILYYCRAPGSANGAKALRSVPAHAGEHYSDEIFLEHGGRAREKRIGRRSHTADGWTAIDSDDRSSSLEHHRHVPVSRSEINAACHDGLVVEGNCHRKRSKLRKTLRKRCEKITRHVLNYEHGSVESFREMRDDLRQSLWPAGRRSDDDSRVRRDRLPLLGSTRRLGAFHAERRLSLRDAHERCGIECAKQFGANGGELDADRTRWLADEFNRAKLERANGERVVLQGSRSTEHNHRPRHLGHYHRERSEPVNGGHLDVERDDVGAERADFRESVCAIACGSDDQKFRPRFNHLADQTAHERAVVDHQHTLRLTQFQSGWCRSLPAEDTLPGAHWREQLARFSKQCLHLP